MKNTKNAGRPGDLVKVLVTGGAGYAGSVLVRRLLRAGHRVVVADRFFFGDDPLRSISKNPRLRMVRTDTRRLEARLLRGAGAVIDMAAVSNDPSGELDPAKTDQINRRARARTARLAKEAGVKRYLLASSCSVYGSAKGLLGEGAPAAPQTAYARANLAAEAAVLRLCSASFQAASLRFATAFGVSARMRFDLAVNAMALGVWRDGRVPVMRGGGQWRPLIHVQDMARAYEHFMSAPDVSGRVFNVGHSNWRIRDLAREVARAAGSRLRADWYGSDDRRSYRASFEAARASGFEARTTVREGAREVLDALESGRAEPLPQTMTVGWYSRLMEAEALYKKISLDGRML